MRRLNSSHTWKSYVSKHDILPFAVLAGSILATFLGWYFYSNYILSTAEEKFDKESSIIVEKIEQRLSHYAQILYSGRGLFVSSQDVERDEWKSFIAAQNIDARFPGIQGVGFQKRTADEDIFLNDMETLRGLGLLNRDPPVIGLDGYYRYIFYLEPVNERNKNAYGYDMHSEPVRRDAIERSRIYDSPALSGKVTLVQEITEKKQFGFLLYLPVYANDQPHFTLEERNEHLIGNVYQPFRIGDFMDGVINKKITSLNFFIFDQSISDENFMYDYYESYGLKSNDGILFTKSIVSENHGRKWVILFHGYDNLISTGERFQSYVVLFGGLTVSLFIFFIMRKIRKENQERHIQELNFKLKDVQYVTEIEQLKTISRMKSEFVSMISHELKTPLVSILGYAEILLNLQSKNMSAEQKDSIQEIHNSASALGSIINDLLDTQKLELNKVSISKDAMDVNELIETLESKLKPIIGDKNITLASHIEGQITVSCDKSRIEQILNNLIKNSIEAIDNKNGKIDIAVRKDQTNVIFSVTDNGIGMSEEIQKNLFQKFYQIDTSLARKSGGSGLGLYISKELVLLHDGKIWVESVLGKGTTVYFSIPT